METGTTGWILLASVLLAPSALGQDCFCLVDADDTVWFDCRAQSRPMRTRPLIFCTDTVSGEQIELTGRPGLDRVADGDAPCTPCRLSDAGDIDHQIRSDGTEPDAATSSDEAAASATAKPAAGTEDQR